MSLRRTSPVWTAALVAAAIAAQQPPSEPPAAAPPSPPPPPAPAEAPPTVETPPPASVPEDAFFESIDVNVVNIDVYVTDKKGNRIRGLKQEDFLVFEDKKPMTITNFYAVDDGGGEPSTAAPAPAPVAPVPPGTSPLGIDTPEDQRLHLVVYVDNWNIMPFNRNRVFTGIREFLRTQLRRGDRVMLMTYDREPHVRRPFTSDPAVIASALFEVEKLSANGSRQDSERREVLREIEEMEDVTTAANRARMYAESVYNDLQFSIDAIKNAVSSLAGLPGRKAVLYVSDGLPLVAGDDIYHAVQEKFREQGGVVLEARSYDTSRRFRELVASANSNRITFYTLDAAGLRTPTSISAEEANPSTSSGFVDSVYWNNIQQSIRIMADETGGVALLNTNDPTKGLQRIGEDLRNYYSLGYSPAHSGDGRYHEVEVRTKNKSWVVRHREGYRDKTAEARMADGVMSSLFYDVESNPMGIVVQRGRETRRDDGHFVVPIEVRIPIGKLVLVPHEGKQVARVRVFIAAMDEEGRISEVQESAVPIEIPDEQVDQATVQHYVYQLPVIMRKGPQKLAVGVRDDVAQSGSFAVRTMNIGAG